MTKPRACRACLSVDVKLHDITETLMAKAFETATGISMSYNIDFPSYLCTYCCKRTQNCVVFRRQCLAAQQAMTALCSTNGQLTPELIKSSDTKYFSRGLTRSVTEYVDYSPLKSRETSPSEFCDGLEIKGEYPLSNDPLSNVAVNYELSDDEVKPALTTYSAIKDYNYPNTARHCQSERTGKTAQKRKPRIAATPTAVVKPNLTDNRELSVNTHLPVKEKRFKCDSCAKRFSARSAWVTHRRTHTGEKPYQCDVCSKSFISGAELTRHRRIHTGERPYACSTCGKSFTTQGTLVRHKRVHTGEKPYKCDACDRRFGDSSSFCKHKRSHCSVRIV